MDLNRYWRAQYEGKNIEVQWSGARFHGGWILRLLVDAEMKAERRVGRFADNYEMTDGPVKVNFWGKAFRHRCVISCGGKVLTDRSQPWNLFAFGAIAAGAVLGFGVAMPGVFINRP